MNFYDCIGMWAQMNGCKTELWETLREPASDARIAQVEAQLEITFPDAFRELYRVHNGQKPNQRLIYGQQLLSLNDIVEKWQYMHIFTNVNTKPICDPKVRNVFGSRRWIPITSGPDDPTGYYYCLDFAPARGGNIGQVILVRDDGGEGIERRYCAPSLEKWLKGFVSRLDEYEFAAGEGIVAQEDPLPVLSVRKTSEHSKFARVDAA